MANAWASQGARKTGPLSSRGMPGTSSAACRAVSGLMDDESGMFEIRLKSFDGDFQLWIRVGAPHFPGIETHRVKPLRILTLAGTDRVGKDMSAVQPLDHTDPVARIARQARMRRRVNVLRAHAVAGFEARRSGRRPAIRTAFCDSPDVSHCERTTSRILRRAQRMPRRDFVRVDEAALDEQILITPKPFFVVRPRQVQRRRHQLDCMTAGIDRPSAENSEGAAHGQHPPFPAMMKNRLVRLKLALAEPIHAPHVMYAVHQAASLGFLGKPAPIMQSRVMRFASCASLQPSVPAGRIGRTK